MARLAHYTFAFAITSLRAGQVAMLLVFSLQTSRSQFLFQGAEPTMPLAYPGNIACPLFSFTHLLVKRPNFYEVTTSILIVGSSMSIDEMLNMLLIEV